MGRLISKTARTRLFTALVMVSFLVGMGPFQMPMAYAADMDPRSIKIGSNTAGATNVSYRAIFQIPTLSTIGSIKLQFCSNSSLVDDSCTAPLGFDASTATTAGSSGLFGFAISNSSPVNEILLTRPPATQAAGTVSYNFNDITNPSGNGSFFARILTYSSSNGTGSYIDAGGLALSIQPAIGASAEVPPYIRFCIGESITNFDCTTATEPFSDLGDLSPNFTSAAQSQIVIATNAQNGYSMWVSGATMMSGGNVINAMSGAAALKGSSQFGLNLRSNNVPQIGQDPAGPGSGGVTANYNQQNQFRFLTGDMLATTPQPDDNRKYTVSYVVNIPAGQAGGVYSTTLTYVCLANF